MGTMKDTKDNGRMTIEMGEENIIKGMIWDMMVIGKQIKRMEKVNAW